MAEEYGKEWRYSLERQHSVHNPVIINEDIELQRRMFWESALHTGITVDFYNCKFEQQDFNQDLNLMWDDAIRLPVIFDDAPKVKVLKNLGWYTEDDERPELVYLPMYKDWMTKELLDVKENSIIRLYYFGGISTADFRVTDKKMDSVYGVYWVCKLAPERMNDFTMIELNGEHFLKRSEVRSRHTEYMDKQISDGYNPDYDKSSDFRNYEHSSYVNQIVDNDEDGGLADNLNYSSTENNNVGYTDKESNENTTFTSIDGKKYIDNFDIIENYEKPKKKDNNSDGRFVVR
jgi:hypothetical protein